MNYRKGFDAALFAGVSERMNKMYIVLAFIFLIPRFAVSASTSTWNSVEQAAALVDDSVYAQEKPVHWKTHYDEHLDISYKYPDIFLDPMADATPIPDLKVDYRLDIYLQTGGDVINGMLSLSAYRLKASEVNQTIIDFAQSHIDRYEGKDVSFLKTRVAGGSAVRFKYKYSLYGLPSEAIYFRKGDTMYSLQLPVFKSKVVDNIISTLKFGATAAEKAESDEPRAAPARDSKMEHYQVLRDQAVAICRPEIEKYCSPPTHPNDDYSCLVSRDVDLSTSCLNAVRAVERTFTKDMSEADFKAFDKLFRPLNFQSLHVTRGMHLGEEKKIEGPALHAVSGVGYDYSVPREGWILSAIGRFKFDDEFDAYLVRVPNHVGSSGRPAIVLYLFNHQTHEPAYYKDLSLLGYTSAEVLAFDSSDKPDLNREVREAWIEPDAKNAAYRLTIREQQVGGRGCDSIRREVWKAQGFRVEPIHFTHQLKEDYKLSEFVLNVSTDDFASFQKFFPEIQRSSSTPFNLIADGKPITGRALNVLYGHESSHQIYMDDSPFLAIGRFPYNNELEAYVIRYPETSGQTALHMMLFDNQDTSWVAESELVSVWRMDHKIDASIGWLIDVDGDGALDVVHQSISVCADRTTPPDCIKQHSTMEMWMGSRFVYAFNTMAPTLVYDWTKNPSAKEQFRAFDAQFPEANPKKGPMEYQPSPKDLIHQPITEMADGLQPHQVFKSISNFDFYAMAKYHASHRRTAYLVCAVERRTSQPQTILYWVTPRDDHRVLISFRDYFDSATSILSQSCKIDPVYLEASIQN